jgi:hypothetical protein
MIKMNEREKLEVIAEIMEEPIVEESSPVNTKLDKIVNYFHYFTGVMVLVFCALSVGALVGALVGHTRADSASVRVCAPDVVAFFKESLAFPYLWHGDVKVFCVIDKDSESVYMKMADF